MAVAGPHTDTPAAFSGTAVILLFLILGVHYIPLLSLIFFL